MKTFLFLVISFFLIPILAFAAPTVSTGPNALSVRTTYSTTPVTTATPVTLIASTNRRYVAISIFDSSGQTMELIITSGAGVDTIVIPPGGMALDFGISRGSLVQIQAVSNNATAGENDITIY